MTREGSARERSRHRPVCARRIGPEVTLVSSSFFFLFSWKTYKNESQVLYAPLPLSRTPDHAAPLPMKRAQSLLPAAVRRGYGRYAPLTACRAAAAGSRSPVKLVPVPPSPKADRDRANPDYTSNRSLGCIIDACMVETARAHTDSQPAAGQRRVRHDAGQRRVGAWSTHCHSHAPPTSGSFSMSLLCQW